MIRTGVEQHLSVRRPGQRGQHPNISDNLRSVVIWYPVLGLSLL